MSEEQRIAYNEAEHNVRAANARQIMLAEELVKMGEFVVVYSMTAYCPSSAVLSVGGFCFERATTRWEAERKQEQLNRMADDCGGDIYDIEIWPKGKSSE